MSIKAFIPGTLVPCALVAVGAVGAVGLLFGALPANAQAKDPVVSLQPMENSDLPAGSQITEERLQETKTKIQEFKAQRAQELQSQEQQQAPQTDAPAAEPQQ